MGKKIRLDKFLADMGKGSRSQIRQAVQKGRVRINGQVEKSPERKLDPMGDKVSLDGERIAYERFQYFMLNKPQGVVSATEDQQYRTVVDLLGPDRQKDVFPVGRLDLDTEGLLLLTNDGELAHQLLSPKKHVDKTYFALVSGGLPEDAAGQMAAGMTLSDGTKVLPARLEVMARTERQGGALKKKPEAARRQEAGQSEAVRWQASGQPEAVRRQASQMEAAKQQASDQMADQWETAKQQAAGQMADQAEAANSQEKKSPQLTEVFLTIQEGKFHQVKRMFEAIGCRVEYLKRVSMGPLVLDHTLLPGQYRRLTEKEIESLGKNPKSGQSNHQGPEVLQKTAGMEAVIFDLDGTLVDSMWMWKAIDIEYLGRHNIPYPSLLQREIEGMSFSETAVYFKEKFQIPDSLEEIKKTWVEMSLEKYQKQVPLKPGVRHFLDFLKAKGIRIGIATSNGWDMVNGVLDALEIRGYFQVIATACEVAAGKPAPDVYLHVARQMGVKPEQCMVFEDVPAGIRSGKAAGMTVCAVEDAYSAHMVQEKRMLADYFIESYDQLFEEEPSNG